MAANTPKRVSKLKVDDPAELAWREETRARDERNQQRHDDYARRVAQGKRVTGEPEYEPWPAPLPDFKAAASPHVTGEVFGRFVLELLTAESEEHPASYRAHDVTRATPECNIDRLSPRVFVHFASELGEHYSEAEACSRCLGS